jgi:ketopantoate hydroxymethyltransferase
MAKVYRDVGAVVLEGLKEYTGEVRERRFPGEAHRFGIADEELAELERTLSRGRSQRS